MWSLASTVCKLTWRNYYVNKAISLFDVCLSVHRCRSVEKTQLDAAECFVALIMCSTCFGHLYVHHQELESMLVLLPHMVCNALVAGGRLLGAEQQAMRPRRGKLCDSRFK